MPKQPSTRNEKPAPQAMLIHLKVCVGARNSMTENAIKSCTTTLAITMTTFSALLYSSNNPSAVAIGTAMNIPMSADEMIEVFLGCATRLRV